MIAEVNLKLIWDVIAAIRIGETGYAIVVDDSGHLIAHPDISLVLRGRASSGSFGRIKHLVGASSGAAVITGDQGKPVVALSVLAADVGWTVIAMQPVSEAFASIHAALWRSSILIAFGVLVALALAYWRAHRMSGPIKQLEEGVERIRTGQFEHRIRIFSGDELQQLALRFNEMASELAISQQKSARIERLKQFLPSQVAELVEHSHELLEGQRREVAVIFGDLRGFTAFSTRNEPDVIMAVMREYYEAVGAVTTRHGQRSSALMGTESCSSSMPRSHANSRQPKRSDSRSTCKRRYNPLPANGATPATRSALAWALRWDRQR